MTDLPDPGTDPVPEEDPYRYPLLARLFGVDVHAQQLSDALDQPDDAVLEESLGILTDSISAINNIAK